MTLPTTDPELVALVATGDDAAYGELYRRHLPAARRRACQLARSDIDAEDLVSDAFLWVLHAIRRGAHPDHFRGYLWTALRTSAYRLRPSRTPYRVVSLSDDRGPHSAPIDIPAPDADPASMSDTEPIRHAFRSLPPRWRVALWLSAVEGRAPADFAAVLDLSRNGAAALACRARRGLRHAYAKTDPAPPPFRVACPDKPTASRSTEPPESSAVDGHRPHGTGVR